MDEGPAALASTIGVCIKRERRGTLAQRAEVAGVRHRMFVSSAQGAVNLSVGTLLRVSDALGVGLPALVEPPQRKAVTVTRAGAGAARWESTAGGCGVLVAGTASIACWTPLVSMTPCSRFGLTTGSPC